MFCLFLRLFVRTRYATWKTMSTQPLSTQDVIFRRALPSAELDTVVELNGCWCGYVVGRYCWWYGDDES